MNLIEAAVEPLKKDAILYAETKARDLINGLLKEMEDNNWDAQIVAPYPNSLRSSVDYHNKLRKYHTVRKITSSPSYSGSRRMNDPEIRVLNQDGIDRMVKEWGEVAALQYENFVAKMVGKIGEVTQATLEGNHIWGYSHLYVTKPDGSKETWRTQMIYKLSKLGKPHNQWPSRKVK